MEGGAPSLALCTSPGMARPGPFLRPESVLRNHGSGFLAQLSLPGQQPHPPSRGEVAGP